MQRVHHCFRYLLPVPDVSSYEHLARPDSIHRIRLRSDREHTLLAQYRTLCGRSGLHDRVLRSAVLDECSGCESALTSVRGEGLRVERFDRNTGTFPLRVGKFRQSELTAVKSWLQNTALQSRILLLTRH